MRRAHYHRHGAVIFKDGRPCFFGLTIPGAMLKLWRLRRAGH